MWLAPQNMVEIYGADAMIQVTNRYSNDVDEIDSKRLQEACAAANSIVYGWLILRFTQEALANASDGIKETLKTHAATIARDWLDSTDETKAHADQSIAWLREFSKGSADGALGGADATLDNPGRTTTIAFEMPARSRPSDYGLWEGI